MNLHPAVAGLAFLFGLWRGEGHGEYPTIEPFGYGEEVTSASVEKPVLAYRRSRIAAALELACESVVTTLTSMRNEATRRYLEVDVDVLRYAVGMAAVGHSITHHLAARLRRVIAPVAQP